MKCARCGKPLDKVFHLIGGNPIGPKCWDKMADKPRRIPKVYLVVQNLMDDSQKELFDETPNPFNLPH